MTENSKISIENEQELQNAVLTIIQGCEYYIDYLKTQYVPAADKYIAALDTLEKYEMIERQ